MFRMDDGIAPRELNVEIIKDGLRNIRAKYKECLTTRKKEICYAIAANELMSMFGSLLPSVWHDPEMRYFILRGTDGILVYDTDIDKLRIVSIEEIVSTVLVEK